MARMKSRRGKSDAPESHDSGLPAPSGQRTPLEAPHASVQGEALTIAGIGASAGGLETFSQILEMLPKNPGMALVLVQHLSPNVESALAALLSAKSKLPVVQVTDGMRVEPDRVYVTPPNVQMELVDDMLHLVPRPEGREQHTPIDHFFESLAAACGSRAIGVILSGTASDGAHGIQQIRAVGGITIAQDPETARYDGMPRAAIATGSVDMILPAGEIAAELARICEHTYSRHVMPAEGAPELEISEAQLQRIFGMLQRVSGVDFTHYKCPTIRRRLHRRMVVHRIGDIEQYIAFMQEHPPEVEKLYHDILINVTRFFRDPESFEAIKKGIFGEILQQHEEGVPIRAWVPGCATGEEAYSLAIALLEFLGDRSNAIPIQVFATDISEPAIEHARNGTYPATIEADVSAERLRRFFIRSDGNYRINKAVRECCVFARQDVTRDPPFSKLDLVLCRNVLIYMGMVLQRKLMSMFHYAMRPWGFLVLGSAETVGAHVELFSIVDKRHRIYRKKPTESPPNLMFPGEYPHRREPRRVKPALGVRSERTVQGEASRIILERFGPPAVIVDDDFQIIHVRGQTGAYLAPAPGEATLNLLKMSKEGLLYPLRSALDEARKKETTVRKEHVRFSSEAGVRELDLEVVPLPAQGPVRHFLVLFIATGTSLPESPAAGSGGSGPAPESVDERNAVLERELANSREYLHSVIQDLEAAHEELQSANEEILSSNEELQSTNEELDTAKEELQSTNEELNTLNEELHARNEEMARVNSDLLNLLGSVNIAIVMVASDLRIRRFTPSAEKVLNLIASDVGRPIGHVKPNIQCPEMERIILEVIDTMSTQEHEVQDGKGNWYSLRVRPYRSIDNRIDGAVLALIDITTAKQYESAIQGARDYAEAVIEALPAPVAVLDAELRVRTANRSFCKMLDLNGGNARGEPFLALASGWKAHELAPRLHEVIERGQSFDDIAVERVSSGTKRQVLRVSAKRLASTAGRDAMILLAVKDMTGQEPSGG